MHLSSHVTVKLQQRPIYSIYTDAGHAVRAPTPWARPAILFLWPPWDNILLLNLLLLCSNRSGLNSHDVADVRKRKKSIFSISASAESDFPECFEDRTTLGVSLSRRWSYLWTPQSRQSHRSFPQRRRRQVSDIPMLSNTQHSSSPALLHIYSVSPMFSSTRSSGNQVSNYLFSSCCLD